MKRIYLYIFRVLKAMKNNIYLNLQPHLLRHTGNRWYRIKKRLKRTAGCDVSLLTKTQMITRRNNPSFHRFLHLSRTWFTICIIALLKIFLIIFILLASIWMIVLIMFITPETTKIMEEEGINVICIISLEIWHTEIWPSDW